MSSASHINQYAGRLRSLLARLRRKRLAVFGVVVVIALGVAVAGISMYVHQYSMERATDNALLAALWSSYKARDWGVATGRTVDAQNGGVTTSEAQAYTMLRAVWSGDRQVFDRTWLWTSAHLARGDGLFSWRYGTLPDGQSGILTSEGGQNTASDADIDVATALLLASARWSDRTYGDQARKVVAAIWAEEIVEAHGQLYLAADNIEKNAATSSFVVNPSYLAPYAFRLFGRVDPTHNWARLTADSYDFLQRVGSAKLGSDRTDGLPPDWVTVDRRTGVLRASPVPGQTTDFGYNAFRTLWRVGLDWQWQRAPAALEALESYQFLRDQWQAHDKLAAIYRRNGQERVTYESLALYGGVLGYATAVDGGMANEIIASKLRPLYDPSRRALIRSLSYYDNNWVWFGIALHDNELPDFAGGAS